MAARCSGSTLPGSWSSTARSARSAASVAGSSARIHQNDVVLGGEAIGVLEGELRLAHAPQPVDGLDRGLGHAAGEALAQPIEIVGAPGEVEVARQRHVPHGGQALRLDLAHPRGGRAHGVHGDPAGEAPDLELGAQGLGDALEGGVAARPLGDGYDPAASLGRGEHLQRERLVVEVAVVPVGGTEEHPEDVSTPAPARHRPLELDLVELVGGEEVGADQEQDDARLGHAALHLGAPVGAGADAATAPARDAPLALQQREVLLELLAEGLVLGRVTEEERDGLGRRHQGVGARSRAGPRGQGGRSAPTSVRVHGTECCPGPVIARPDSGVRRRASGGASAGGAPPLRGWNLARILLFRETRGTLGP